MLMFCSLNKQKVASLGIGKYLNCIKKTFLNAFSSNLVKAKFLSVTNVQHKEEIPNPQMLLRNLINY